nr:MAG TPA: hypothetical protein [Herelleviridae sp.]
MFIQITYSMITIRNRFIITNIHKSFILIS